MGYRIHINILLKQKVFFVNDHLYHLPNLGKLPSLFLFSELKILGRLLSRRNDIASYNIDQLYSYIMILER